MWQQSFQINYQRAVTGVSGMARVSQVVGEHLRLPGYDDEGPTLEIYTYSVQAYGEQPSVNRPGFGHIAFSVADVIVAKDEVLAAGGKAVRCNPI